MTLSAWKIPTAGSENWGCQEFRARPGHNRKKKAPPDIPSQSPDHPQRAARSAACRRRCETTFISNGLLEAAYALVFLDAIRVEIPEKSLVRNKAIHMVIDVRANGLTEVLGLWNGQNEGAKFWLRAWRAAPYGARQRKGFSSDDAAMKPLFLVLNRSEKEWRMPPRERRKVKAQIAVLFGDRFAKGVAA